MQTYVVLRRNGWHTPAELEEAAARSTRASESMPDQVRWLRSYALDEPGGGVGTICVYQATGEEALREHAARAGLPADEIVPVADTMIVNADPAPTPS